MKAPIAEQWLALNPLHQVGFVEEPGDRCIMVPPCAEPFEFVTVYVDAGHAPLNLPPAEAVKHYQRPVAEIQVSNRITLGDVEPEPRAGLWIEGSRMLGRHPIWARRLSRCDLSPDWRRIDGRMQMIAVLAIRPGYTADTRRGRMLRKARLARQDLVRWWQQR